MPSEGFPFTESATGFGLISPRFSTLPKSNPGNSNERPNANHSSSCVTSDARGHLRNSIFLMITQTELDLGVKPLIKTFAGDSIQERFELFHKLNPWVLTALERLACAEMQSGFRTSVDYLVHQLRWHYRRTIADPKSDFRISNDYTSRYARLLLEKNPSLRHIITTKALKSA